MTSSTLLNNVQMLKINLLSEKIKDIKKACKQNCNLSVFQADIIL